MPAKLFSDIRAAAYNGHTTGVYMLAYLLACFASYHVLESWKTASLMSACNKA